MNTLPEMSAHEASWHEHLAGMRAKEAARKQGADPTAIAALASATAGPVEIAGFHLQPASQGTIWTLKRLAREFATWAQALGMPTSVDAENPGTREMIELGLTTLVFCDSRQCWLDLESGQLENLILRAEGLVWGLEVQTLAKLQAHFQNQMDAISTLSSEEEAPGKLSLEKAASGTSPAMPIPPVAADSQPPSGLQPSTPSPLPQPSGTQPSASP